MVGNLEHQGWILSGSRGRHYFFGGLAVADYSYQGERRIVTLQQEEPTLLPKPDAHFLYYRELASRNTAHYVVLRRDGEIIGYGGMWRMYDEAHVTTIGVRRDQQHGGFGRVLFAGLVQAAYDLGAKWVTLEVRTSNVNAMRMYEAFGFKVIGRRRGYYTDNGEDAIVMWSDSIYSPRFRKAFEANLARIEGDVSGLRREPPLADR